MIKRIYATRLMGISDADRRRLETDEQKRATLIQAERFAEEHGLGIDDVLREAQEMEERIQRWGLQPELRRLAQEFGMSEEEVRADYEAGRKECGL